MLTNTVQIKQRVILLNSNTTNEWFTLEDAVATSGYTLHTLKEYIKAKKIKRVKPEGKQIFLHKDEVQLLSDIKSLSNPVSSIVEGKLWYSMKEASIITGYSDAIFKKDIKSGKILDYKKIGHYFVVNIHVVEEYLHRKQEIREFTNSNEEEKEWFTLDEAQSVTGFNKKSFWANIKNGNIQNHKKVNGRVYIHREVLNLFKTIKSDGADGNKEWYSTKEAEKLTGYRAENFTRLIRSKEITNYTKIGFDYYIHKSVVQEYSDIKSKIEREYVSYTEASKLLGKKVSTIQQMCAEGQFGDTVRFGRYSYIKRTIIEKHLNEIDNYISTTSAIEASGLSPHIVTRLIKDNIIRAKQENNYLYFIEKDSFSLFLDTLKSSLSKAEVCSLLDIEEREFDRYVEMSLLKVYNSSIYGIRVTKDDIKQFKVIKQDYYTVQDICSEYGLKSGVVLKRIREGVIEAKYINNQFYLVDKDVFHKFIGSLDGIKLCYFGKHNYYEFFDKFSEAIYNLSRYKESIQLYREWAMNRIKNSNSSKKKSLTNYLVLTLERLFNLLRDEIFNYTDNDIASLFKENEVLAYTDLEMITGFINFCKTKRKCAFSNNYNFHSTVDFNKSKEEKIYSKNEWIDYYNYLINMDIHKEKAIQSRRYAETWLFIILHLSLSWRASDIVKMPNVPLEVIGIEGFEWFDTNDFTLELAQTIINEMRRRCLGIETNKTRTKAHFVVGLFLTVPTALAFVICEIHRRNSENRGSGIFTYKPYRTNDYKLVLGEDLVSFSSIKSNRSLMTYQFETAVKKEGRAHIAYQLCSYARSHKMSMDKHNQVTKVYLHTTNTDASIENMAFHLFERGFFGWQIGLMLNLLYDAGSWDLSSKTSVIKEVGKEFSPINIESLSEHLNIRHGEAESLLKELLQLPIDRIHEKLEKISEFKSPALIDYSQCIKGIENCEYKKSIACFGCKYRVSTNYVLELVNNELFNLIDLLENVPISAFATRQKYTHMINKLMHILMDFKVTYKEYDANYINSFINMQELKRRYQELEITKFLYLGGTDADIKNS